MQFEDAAIRIERATDYALLFGAASDTTADKIRHTYREFARTVHPDTHQGKDTYARSQEVFAKLTHFYGQAIEMTTQGKYGQPTELVVWHTRRATHTVTDAIGKGDLCGLYTARTQLADGSNQATFCKVAQLPSDNDLLETEASVLRRLRGTDSDVKLHPFYPELSDSFTHSETGMSVRRVNVLSQLEGFSNLAQVRELFPTGLDPLHMAWIWRRVLWALDHAHQHRIIHGAVVPEHIMILPEQHGVVLVDWCYASQANDTQESPPVRAIVSAYKDWYPEEVFDKSTPSPATDIAMAARCMTQLMGGDPLTGNYPTSSHVPGPVRVFFKGCLGRSQASRPQDALQLLDEFDQLLQRLGQQYYPAKYR